MLFALLGSCLFVGMVYGIRSPTLALKRSGIRIVSLADPALSEAACEALVLLETYDQEMFVLVKKHVRMILLCPSEQSTHPVPTGRFYFLYSMRLFKNGSKKDLPVQLAGSLVSHATMAELNGWVAHFDKVQGASILESCQNQQRQTLEKLKRSV